MSKVIRLDFGEFWCDVYKTGKAKWLPKRRYGRHSHFNSMTRTPDGWYLDNGKGPAQRETAERLEKAYQELQS